MVLGKPTKSNQSQRSTISQGWAKNSQIPKGISWAPTDKAAWIGLSYWSGQLQIHMGNWLTGSNSKTMQTNVFT